MLALWTHYYAALAIAPQAMWLIGLAYRDRSRTRASAAAIGATTLAGLPLIPLLVYEVHEAWPYAARVLSSPWHRTVLTIHDSSSTFSSLIQDVTDGPGGPARSLLTAVIVLVGLGLALYLLRRPERVQRELPRVLCLSVPPLLIVAVAIHSHILFEGRYLLALWLPVGLAASWALTSIGRGRNRRHRHRGLHVDHGRRDQLRGSEVRPAGRHPGRRSEPRHGLGEPTDRAEPVVGRARVPGVPAAGCC